MHWFKNDDLKLTDETATLKRRQHRHTLVFEELREEDYGNYTCRARNKLGEMSKKLEVSGESTPLKNMYRHSFFYT